jgi:hypothetical protein
MQPHPRTHLFPVGRRLPREPLEALVDGVLARAARTQGRQLAPHRHLPFPHRLYDVVGREVHCALEQGKGGGGEHKGDVPGPGLGEQLEEPAAGPEAEELVQTVFELHFDHVLKLERQLALEGEDGEEVGVALQPHTEK